MIAVDRGSLPKKCFSVDVVVVLRRFCDIMNRSRRDRGDERESPDPTAFAL